MVKIYFVILLVIIIFISCNGHKNKSKQEKPYCKTPTIDEFNAKCDIDTIRFSCFNDVFYFNYKNIILNDNYVFLPKDPIKFHFNYLNLYEAVYKCYYKDMDSCCYNCFMVVDSLKTIKHLLIKDYRTNKTLEFYSSDSLLFDTIFGIKDLY